MQLLHCEEELRDGLSESRRHLPLADTYKMAICSDGDEELVVCPIVAVQNEQWMEAALSAVRFFHRLICVAMYDLEGDRFEWREDVRAEWVTEDGRLSVRWDT